LTPHAVVNPPELAPPVGFSHGVATRGGRVLWLAGQNGTDGAGRIKAPGDLVAQTDAALANVLTVVRTAGGRPEHVVKLHLWVLDAAEYRAARRGLAGVWRAHFGSYYPAMMLIGASGFYDADALIEIDGFAVIPDDAPQSAGAT